MVYRAKAPLRVSFAGGGTDVPPFPEQEGGLVLNATINRHAYGTLRPREDSQIQIESADFDMALDYDREEGPVFDGKLDLVKAAIRKLDQEGSKGFELFLHSSAPPGSGLGSSSTLMVTLIGLLKEFHGLPMTDYEVAELSYHVEREDLGIKGGLQDQYAATFGGFNFMEFHPGERVVVNPLRIKNWIISELEASLLLYFGGVSRDSAKIIDEQSDNVTRNQSVAIDAMHALKGEAIAMKESLLRGDFEQLVESVRAGWEAKKQMAKSISNPQIDEIYELAQRAGMRAGKISGAGGGGFMMMLVDPVRRMDVMRALQQMPGQIFTCHFTKYGTQGWKLY